MEFIVTLLAFIVAISVLVVVHEFGHYWVARRVGVKVLRFSVGFGRPLWSRRAGRDGTEWAIAALPLGGYVKMLDENDGQVGRHELHRAFNRQSIPKRTAVVLAGPLFNFLFAILAYWIVFMAGVDGIKPVVGKVVEGSIAQQAGFRVGDELVTIDGKPTLSWDQRRLYLYQQALDQARVDVTVRDPDGVIRERVLDLSALSPGRIGAGLMEKEIGLYGYFPEVPPVVGSVEPNGPAARAGLATGDRITAIAGEPMHVWQDVVTAVRDRPNQTVSVEIDRGGQRLSMDVVPQAHDTDGQAVGRIGIAVKMPEIPPHLLVTVRQGPLTALVESAQNTWLMSALTLKMLVKMLKLEVSTKTISGPITIAQYAGYSARIGVDRFLMFLAIVSISLGVLNLLPIPVLDGGHLLYYMIEAVKGGPLSERVMAWGQQIGIALLLALMALAFYNDITRLVQ